jgi:hypothetical protein
MTKTKFYANAITPKPSDKYSLLSETERMILISKATSGEVGKQFEIFDIVSAKTDGQVILRLRDPLSSDIRGTLLLDYEELLKDLVDQGLTVWLEPLGDRSSLRNLRGIEVKS